MDAGLLRQRISIYADVGTTRSDRNQHIEQDSLFMQCWAGVTHVDSNEPMYGNKVTPINSYTILIRYQPDLVPTQGMAIEWGSKRLNIVSVVVDENKDGVLIGAIEDID